MIFTAERFITPNICMFNDENCETLNIQVDLPGVTKDSINFTFLEKGFYIIAKAQEGIFKGSFALPGPVIAQKALAEYSNGLLSVNVPYMLEQAKSFKVRID